MSGARLPRLLTFENNSWKEVRRIHPISGSLEMNITPLSTANLTVKSDEIIPVRSWVEMFTPYGSAGIFRARSPQGGYGDTQSTIELEHGITEVGDFICNEEKNASMGIGDALRYIFQNYYKGSKWQLGTITQTDTVILDVNRDNVLETILSLLEQTPNYMLTFDFNTTPWTVGLVNRGMTVMAEGRLDRNVTSANISYDDSELATRVYVPYDSEDEDGSSKEVFGVYNADASSIQQYGLIEKTLSGSGYSQEQAAHVANLYLAKHCKPIIGVEIDAVDLSRITGETLDSYSIGKLYRLAIPKYGVTIEENITAISYDNLYEDSLHVTVSLADAEDAVYNVIKAVRDNASATKTNTKNGSRGGVSKSGLIADRDHLYYDVYDPTGTVHAEIEVTAEEIHTRIDDEVDDLSSSISQQADRISIVVEGTGQNAHVKPAVIEAAITDNNGTLISSIKISADNIDIDGDTFADYLQGTTINCDELNCDTLSASDGSFSSLIVESDTLTVDGNNISNPIMSVTDGTYSGNSKTVTFTHADGTEDTVTFSRAISSASWDWVGGAAKVTLSPQNQTYYSTAIDAIQQNGSQSWESDKKHFSVRIDVDDSSGTTVFHDTLRFSALDAYNAGEAAGAGTATANYNRGWNECRSATLATASTKNRYTGTPTTKYDAPTGGASPRDVLYPYQQANVTTYTIPAAK